MAANIKYTQYTHIHTNCAHYIGITLDAEVLQGVTIFLLAPLLKRSFPFFEVGLYNMRYFSVVSVLLSAIICNIVSVSGLFFPQAVSESGKKTH